MEAVNAGLVDSNPVTWKALDKESEEFRLYYRQRQREGFYHKLNLFNEMRPNDDIASYWRTLDKHRQDAILNQIIDSQPIDRFADLDDENTVGHMVFMCMYAMIHRKAAKENQKKPGSKFSTTRSDGLLRKAIQRNQFQQ
ncbi:hypothetical protein BDN70DRAFT_897968 [Pholiota conissans]|uniref:Uncharacterized protein n=1 Tax=Pholiota conissans TaxID=109636 RepID=A0A9P5YUJ6_9AGAR|nr:hypothetical protein BDN70DRAFT_897968 [Pholiota conissans]